MTTATLWRINVTAVNGGSSVAVRDFQFRTVAGAPEQFNSDVVVGVSASSEVDSSYNASDANYTTAWTTASGVTSATWQAEYYSGVEIQQFLVRAGDPASAPKDFTLEYSTDNGSTWTVADTRAGETGWSDYEIRAYTVGVSGHTSPPALFNISSTKWRVNITRVKDRSGAVDAPDFVCLYNFQLGTDDYVPLLNTYGGTVSASSYDSSFPPAQAINDDAYDGGWETPAGTTTGWIQYEFPVPFAPLLYKVEGGGPYNSSFDWIKYSSPVDFTLQYWTGADWAIAEQVTGLTGQDYYMGVVSGQESGGVMPGGTGSPTSADGNVNFGDPQSQGPAYYATPFVVGEYPSGFAMDGDVSLSNLLLSGSLQGPLSLQALGLSAHGVSGTVAYGASAFEQLTLSGDLSAPPALEMLGVVASGFAGMASSAAATLQPLDGASVALAGTASEGALAFVALDADADTGMAGDLLLSAIDAAGAALAGSAATGAALFEKLVLAADAMQDALPADGNAALSLLALAGVSLAGSAVDGAVAFAALSVNAAGPAADLENGDAMLPSLDVGGQAQAGALAAGDAALAALSVDSALFAPNNGDGLVTLSALAQLNAQAISGAVGDGTPALSVLTLAATAYFDTTADGVATLLPATLAAAMINAPLLVADGDVALLSASVSATALPGTAADGTVALAALSVSAAGISDTLAAADATLPALSLAGVMLFGGAPTVADGAAALPPMLLPATLLPGALADGASAALPLSLSAAGYVDGDADGTVMFAVVSLSGALVGDVLMAGAATLGALDVAAAGAPGATAVAMLDVPLLQVNADGFADAVGTATIALPVLSLDAAGVAEVFSPSFVGIALNTHTRAVSTYDGLAFNSMTQFNGLVLAATASGIVALAGDTDLGQPIAAGISAGVSDLGAEPIKRVLAGYVGYRANGALELTMVADGHHEYVYRLEPRRLGDLHASRVKFGRGAEGRYWQWKLNNRDGADFALDALTLDAAVLSRRVR